MPVLTRHNSDIPAIQSITAKILFVLINHYRGRVAMNPVVPESSWEMSTESAGIQHKRNPFHDKQ